MAVSQSAPSLLEVQQFFVEPMWHLTIVLRYPLSWALLEVGMFNYKVGGYHDRQVVYSTYSHVRREHNTLEFLLLLLREELKAYYSSPSDSAHMLVMQGVRAKLSLYTQKKGRRPRPTISQDRKSIIFNPVKNSWPVTRYDHQACIDKLPRFQPFSSAK